MPDPADNKRQFPRIPKRHTVLVKRLGAESIEGFAATKTLGLGGCSFFTDEPPGVGSALDVLISLEREVVRAKARVVYQNENDGRWEVGAEFIELSERDRERLAALFADASADS